jgi:RHS repeat-associated protein
MVASLAFARPGAAVVLDDWNYPNHDRYNSNASLNSSLPKYIGRAWSVPLKRMGTVLVQGTNIVIDQTNPGQTRPLGGSVWGINLRTGAVQWKHDTCPEYLNDYTTMNWTYSAPSAFTNLVSISDGTVLVHQSWAVGSRTNTAKITGEAYWGEDLRSGYVPGAWGYRLEHGIYTAGRPFGTGGNIEMTEYPPTGTYDSDRLFTFSIQDFSSGWSSWTNTDLVDQAPGSFLPAPFVGQYRPIGPFPWTAARIINNPHLDEAATTLLWGAQDVDQFLVSDCWDASSVSKSWIPECAGIAVAGGHGPPECMLGANYWPNHCTGVFTLVSPSYGAPDFDARVTALNDTTYKPGGSYIAYGDFPQVGWYPNYPTPNDFNPSSSSDLTSTPASNPQNPDPSWIAGSVGSYLSLSPSGGVQYNGQQMSGWPAPSDYLAQGQSAKGSPVILFTNPFRAYVGTSLYWTSTLQVPQGCASILGDGTGLATTTDGLLVQVNLDDGSVIRQFDGKEIEGDGQLSQGYVGKPIAVVGGVLVFSQSVSEGYSLVCLGSVGPTAGYPSGGIEPLGKYLVNSLSGNKIFTRTDIKVPGQGLSVNIQRTYNSSLAGLDGPMGQGWTFNYDMNVIESGLGHVALHRSDGGTNLFGLAAPGTNLGSGAGTTLTMVAQAGVSDLMLRDPSGDLRMLSKDGTSYHFHSIPASRGDLEIDDPDTATAGTMDGKLLDITDRNNNQVVLNYTQINMGQNHPTQWEPTTIVDATGRSLSIMWDFTGHIMSISAPDGSSITYQIAGDGDLMGVFGAGYASTYNYDGISRQLKFFTDPLAPAGQKNLFINYDDQSGRVSSIYPGDNLLDAIYYTYADTAGILPNQIPSEWTGQPATEIKDPRGTITLDLYDFLGRLLEERKVGDGKTLTTKYVWDVYNNLTQQTDPMGLVTTYGYSQDYFGDLLSKTNPLNLVYTYTYNQFHEVLTSNEGLTTSYAYDAQGNMTQKTVGAGTPDQVSWTYTIAPGGLRQSQTDPNGNITNYSYDKNGNLTETDAPAGRHTRAQYDSMSRKILDVDALGHSTSYSYWISGLPNVTRYADGGMVENFYDSLFNLEHTVDQLNRITRYVHNYFYPGRDLLESVVTPFGHTDYTYDQSGNKLTETNPNQATTTYTYDAFNRVKTVTDPATADPAAHGSATYTYDNDGRLLKIQPSAGPATQFTYDVAGERTGFSNGAESINYVYDGAGRLVNQIDGAGRQDVTVYNGAGRAAQTQYSGGGGDFVVLRTFDPNGNMVKQQRVLSGKVTQTLNYTYGTANELLTADDPLAASVQKTYAYDLNLNMTELTIKGLQNQAGPVNYDAQYTYDLRNRISGAYEGGTQATYHYDLLGNPLSIWYGNGVKTNYTYTSNGQLSSLIHSGPTGPLQSFQYLSYDPMQNLLTAQDELGAETYTYDALNRLSTVTYPNTGLVETGPAKPAGMGAASPQPNKISYTYDMLGNRQTQSWAQDGQTVLTQYQYDAGNRLIGWSDSLGASQSYSYNGAGDLTTGMTYDSAGQLIGANLETNSYSMDGDRIFKSGPSGRLGFIVSNNQTVADLVDSGTAGQYWVKAKYLRGNGGDIVSQTNYVNQKNGPPPTIDYIQSDRLGSISLVTDSKGSLISRSHYLPFGQRLEGESALSRFGFTGQEGDVDAQLTYFHHRWLNTGVGRFSQVDTSADYQKLSDLNLYVYVSNNPINNTDPLGLFEIQPFNGKITLSKDMIFLGKVKTVTLLTYDSSTKALDATWAVTDTYQPVAAGRDITISFGLKDGVSPLPDWLSFSFGLPHMASVGIDDKNLSFSGGVAVPSIPISPGVDLEKLTDDLATLLHRFDDAIFETQIGGQF